MGVVVALPVARLALECGGDGLGVPPVKQAGNHCTVAEIKYQALDLASAKSTFEASAATHNIHPHVVVRSWLDLEQAQGGTIA